MAETVAIIAMGSEERCKLPSSLTESFRAKTLGARHLCNLRMRDRPSGLAGHFSAIIDRAITKGRSVCLSVCPSVCPSDTLVSHAEVVQDIEVHFGLYNRAIFGLLEPIFVYSRKFSGS